MDELQRSIYVTRFRLAFHTQRGAAFQDWFVRLAGYEPDSRSCLGIGRPRNPA
jgi:hypothetical protein